MALNGNCGGVVPGNKLLPVLVGDGVPFCPTAAGLNDSEIKFLGDMAPSLHGQGWLDGVPLLSVPQKYREALLLARGLMAVWESRKKAQVHHHA